jgi:predicted transcriptional regulator
MVPGSAAGDPVAFDTSRGRSAYCCSSMSRHRFAFWGFKSPRDWVGTALGTLERQVMDLAWSRPELSVREVHDQIGGQVAYTTVMTTCDRLYKKGLLTRHKTGRAFVYAATLTREALDSVVASELVGGLLQQGDSAGSLPMLSSLVDAVSARDRALLHELERLVTEKRDALAREDQG